MVTTEEKLCTVIDCMPKPTQKRQKFKLRPAYKVSNLFDDIKRSYNYESFVLRLEAGQFEPVILNNYRNQTLQEAGLQFNKDVENIISILPLADYVKMDTSDQRMTTDDSSQISQQPHATGGDDAVTCTASTTKPQKIASAVADDASSDLDDDDLALGASASPTESNAAIPVPPAPPELPPMLGYLETSASTSTRTMSFRRVNSNERTNHFVGLVNQAMTCYLNSLLQALFMTPEFRNALYNWEFDGNGETKSIPYQLQKLFLNLQTSTKMAVETTDLTKSFGWDSTEAWQQHDIQELCRVMFDALEHKFKNTKEADLINRLYEGKMTDYVKCLECGTEKSREDTFLDIPLPVRPFGSTNAYGSVEEALRAFVQPEILNENNQYHCEKCNKKCDAHKGLKFAKFPYILTLHLKRFDFDYQTLQRIKLNDQVTFPQTLNVNGFVNQEPITPNGPLASDAVSIGESVESAVKCDDCSTTDSGSALEDDSLSGANFQAPPPHHHHHQEDLQDDDEGIDMNTDGKSTASTANEQGPYIYELFAIMIHSGSASGGHYYAYIKDFESGNWYSFNDQTVSSITQEDIQKSFGGSSYKAYYSSAYSSSTNAYMLMYRQIDSVRNSKCIKEDQFPEHIKKLKEHLKDTDRHHITRDYSGAGSGSDIVTKLKVFFYNPQMQRMTDTKIYISSDSTLEETVEEAHRKLAKHIAPLDRFRLVAYDSCSEMIERSLEGREMHPINEVMNAQRNNAELLLEMREEAETFEIYHPGGINTKVYQIDLQTNDIDGPVQIRGLMSGTVLEYKQLLARKFRLNADNLIVIKIGASGDQNTGVEYSCTIATVLNDDTVTLTDEKLHLSHKIFIAEASVMNDDVRQAVKEIVERYEHIITLYFVLPATDQDTLNQMSIPPYKPDLTPLMSESMQPSPKTPTTPTMSRDCVDAVCFTGPASPPHVLGSGEYQARGNAASAGASHHHPVSSTSLPEVAECNSEDSSLSDSDRTLVDVAQDDLSHISTCPSESPPYSSPDDSHRGAISDCDPDNDIEMASIASAGSPINPQHHHHHHHQQQQRAYYFRATPYTETMSTTDDEPQRMLKVLVDRSMAIGTLKRHLEPILKVSHQYFRIFYASSGAHITKSVECTRLNDTLSIFKDGEKLVIDLGRALRKGEHRCKIFYLNLKEIDHDTDKLPLICEWIISENTTVANALQDILAHVTKINPKYAGLNVNNSVLRQKNYKSPTKVLLNDQIFGDDIYLSGSEIQLILQELHENSPRYEDQDDTIYFARRWYPSTRSFGEFHEIILKKKDSELKEEMSKFSAIPEENLEYSRLQSSFPRCSVSISSIPNLVWTSDQVTSADPWTAFSDGNLFFYKDKTEPLKELTTEERNEAQSKLINEVSSTSRISTYSPRRERGLKIYVDSSPRNVEE